MGMAIEHLTGLYAKTPDPWNFRTSAYEDEKYRASIAALSRHHYEAILEIGCGNGELGKRLRRLADRYAGLDAVPAAIAEARLAVPSGEFHCDFFPCPLPGGSFDLIVVSEFLYFLDEAGIADLAERIRTAWPLAEVLSVNYTGPTGNHLQGEPAAWMFMEALGRGYRAETVPTSGTYRIDRLTPRGPGEGGV
ncbi:class I SAM-dependent methyltransferase [Microbaculum marinum]|uniref:SAM-dependent methyltransferase n=1 Tax=Microbaculum marinum TaxID=1764581 RepID=A0AAW9RLA6_9HYPH